MKPRILIVDDEPGMVSSCADVLHSKTDDFLPEVEVGTATNGAAVLDRLAEAHFDLLITDLRMPDMDGLELVQRAREIDPDLVTVIITAYPTIETANEALREGAAEYLVKPFTAEQLRLVVGRCLSQRRLREENRWLRRQLTHASGSAGIVGVSPGMREVSRLIGRVAQSTASVLILGETGTGKGLVARAIHDESPRRDKSLIQVDCGAFPDHLLESELFGHEKGSFTGAHAERPGLLECANESTFFLDEICELPLTLQAKLLGFLQNRWFRRIGGRDPIAVDVRMLAATNRDIESMVAAGEFRKDLYYRLNVIQLEVPPLRDRLEDVSPLVTHFIDSLNRKNWWAIHSISTRALACLETYRWPGNVRELENVIERAASLTVHETLDVEDLPDHMQEKAETEVSRRRSFAEAREAHLCRFERAFLEGVLTETGGNVREAAARANLPRTTMYRYLAKHDLEPRTYR